MKKPLYIIIEGNEGCGKDIHCDLITKWLESLGRSVKRTKEPGGTPESEKIRKILLSKKNKLSDYEEFFLFQAARRENYEKIVKPCLEKGIDVVKSRGWPSTIAYQGFAGGLDIELIKKENKFSTKGILPDVLFIIDIDIKKGLEKEVSPDRFAEKGLEYHQKVKNGYLSVIRENEFAIRIPYIENGVEYMQETIKKIIKKIK